MPSNFDFNGLNILVIEDHPSQRSAISTFLARYGCRDVHEAADGEEALKVIGKVGKLDLILCDVGTKSVDGLHLVKALRAGLTRAPHDTPVVVLTARSGPELTQAASDLRVDGYVVKPVLPSQLAEKIRQIAQAPRAAGTNGAGKPQGEPVSWKKGAPCSLATLKPGDIVAEDVMTAEGVVLLPRGTPLTEENIEFVREHSAAEEILVLE